MDHPTPVSSPAPRSGEVAQPHPEFIARKEQAWQAFFDKDYETTARLASQMLMNSHAFDAIHLAGLSLTKLGQVDKGFDWCCASLALSNAFAEWYSNCALGFMDTKDYARAMVFLQNGAQAHPGNVRISYMRALCMCHAQQWEQAMRFCDETSKLDPTFYHATMTKGFCYHMQGDYQKAIDCYQSIKHMAPPLDHEDIVNNHACVLLEMGKPYEALALLNKECLDQKRPGTIYNKSFCYLGLGIWPDAWEMYRNRTTVQVNFDQGVPLVDQPLAQTLDDIKGKTVFMFHEQGLGDSLQFVRYAPLLRAHCKHLIIGVPPALERVVKLLDIPKDDFEVIAGRNLDTDKETLAVCDVALPMLTAPAVLKQRLDNIPRDKYFRPVPYELVKQRYIGKRGHRDAMRVGLVWAGASRVDNIRAHSIDRRRSVPYSLMEPVLQLSEGFHIDFVSLQQPDNHVDDPRLVQPIKQEFDILDTAAVIEQLDLVIAIDSAIAHLAAAFGKPTWLLSRFDNCWRWFWCERGHEWYDKSPWYPAMKLYRQHEPGNWPAVIQRVREDLLALL